MKDIIYNINFLDRENDILDLYLSGKTAKEVSKIIGCSDTTVLNKLRKHNIKIRPSFKRYYNINEDYFEYINTPEKSYILGFIAADGCNMLNQLIICINKKDIEVLNFIKSQICKDSIIVETKDDMLRLVFSSIKLCKDLENLGIVKAKTEVLKFPNKIPNNLISHFIRGFFDGDGCISYKKRENPKWKPGIRVLFTCASREFIESLRDLIIKECYDEKIISIDKRSWLYYLEYQRKDTINKLYNFIYKDDCFSLHRKKNKFLI